MKRMLALYGGLLAADIAVMLTISRQWGGFLLLLTLLGWFLHSVFASTGEKSTL